MSMTNRRAMELGFEEYCDADLSLTQGTITKRLSHYVPDLAEAGSS